MYEHDKKGKLAKDESGKLKIKTSHTLNPVPLYVYAPGLEGLAIDTSVQAPGLGNLAATTLHLLGYQAPEVFLPSLLK
jgi:2,3-bisphosphoglycerate-independent phosphoglycerate mutase